MDLIKIEDISSITLFSIRLSEGEMQVIADALSYLLDTYDENELQKIFKDEKQRVLETPSETKEFVQETYKEVMVLLQQYSRKEFLPARYKEWKKNG